MLSLLNFLQHAALVSSHEEQALHRGKTERKVEGCSLVTVECQLLQHLEGCLQNSAENAVVPIQTNLLHSETASSYTCFQTRI